MREHGRAVEADLLRAGWRLGDLTWTELISWIRHPVRDSALARSLVGPDHEWRITDHLIAGVHDRLAEANWQRGGGKGPKPRPLPRPGAENKGRRFGGSKGRTPAEMKAELARMAGRAPMGSRPPGLPEPGYEPGQDAKAQAAIDLDRALPTK